MTDPIGNPLSWSVDHLNAAGKHLGTVASHVGSADAAKMPAVRSIGMADIRQALRKGFEDFEAVRSDVAFLCILYPMIGIFMAWIALHRSLLPLLFPAMSGFALVGPVAAVGLYEMSRRREQGQETSWADAFSVVKSPSFGSIFVLGLMLFATFVVWIMVANGIYLVTIGPEMPASIGAFARAVLTTPAGWALIVFGCAIGFVFAVLVLVTSVVSFPLLLDRDVGLPVAVVTSVRVAARNPGPIAVWGLVVAVGLALGSVPLFLGLIVVMPVLGHATWHLYRRAVV